MRVGGPAMFEWIDPTDIHDTTGYAHAVRMGDVVFVSGQVALDEHGALVGEADVRAQVEQVFRNLKVVVEAAGSSLDRVGKLNILAVSPEALPHVRDVRNRIWEPLGYFPASTFAIVAGLARPEFLVEIEAVAYIDRPAHTMG
jgi:enamine deaminase RidA (YjgF/YER057c/UK114 family)